MAAVDISQAGTIRDGSDVFVPSGTTRDWNLLLSPTTFGFIESGSDGDNALLKYEVSASELGNRSGWNITAKWHFRTGNSSSQVRENPMDVNFLMVKKQR